MTMQAVEVEIEDDVPDTMAIASTPCSPLPATTSALLLRWFEELLRVLSSILWHALLAVPASPNPVPQNFLHGRLARSRIHLAHSR